MYVTNRTNHRRFALAALAAAALTALVVGAGGAPAGKAAEPSNTSPPTISGKAQEGETLKADPGEWSGDKPIDFSYQWRRCNASGGSCSNIGKATDQIYTARSADVGRTLRVVVTAVNGDGAASAVSKQTAVVTAAPPQAPRNTSLPAISGKAEQGEVLTAQPGGWDGSKPMQFSFRWRRCDAKGGDCANTSETGQTYKLGSDDVGRTLRVLVTATNSAGSGAAISNPTSVIQGTEPPPPPPGTCVPISGVSLPQRLVVDRIEYTPSRIHSRSEPLVARFHVVTTRGNCVSGAVVFAVGVPFNRLSAGQETQTGPDGWAQISFRVLPTFELRPGNLVVIFVRARKPGESILAGVSTRRLVSVRVGALS